MITEEIWKYIKTILHVVSDNGITNTVTLTDGKSGAEVYRIGIISRRERETGTYIVKLINTSSKWYNKCNNEAQKSINIYTTKTAFKNRLVELCSDEVIDGYHVLISRQANDSITNTSMLDKLKVTEQMKVLESISYELLQNWNDTAVIEQIRDNVFKKMLSYRLEENGAFKKRIRQILQTPMDDAFFVQDKIYPNPLYYIQNQQKWINNKQGLMFFKGNVHGDLHRRNIMCEKEFSKRDDVVYFVIDYDSYMDDGFLLFDHAYLELSIYIDYVLKNPYGIKQWDDLITVLLTTSLFEDAEGGVDEPLIYLRNSICKGISKWARKRYPHMRDSIEIQFFFSRIMAGINYFSKGAIEDHESLIKIMMYIGKCFQILFEKLEIEWKADNVSNLISILGENDSIDELWEKCVKYTTQYIPVLITDDCYESNDYMKLDDLVRVKWALVIDIGEHSAPNDISTVITQRATVVSNLIMHNLVAGNSSIEYSNGSCVWIVAKKDQQVPTYGILWARHQKVINNLFEQIMFCNGLKPFVFVWDIKKGQPFIQKFLQCILNSFERLRGSRFIALGNQMITDDDVATIKELGCYYTSMNTTLIGVVETVKKYFPPLSDTAFFNKIFLPTIGIMKEVPLTEKEINYYESSVELVYAGMEGNSQDIDYGEEFYRGAEIKWSDLANGCDLKLIESYEKKRDLLLKVIEEDSPRVKLLKLIHGAGTGGTTLAKRLLWDLKEQVPCVRLKKYTQETADILLEIYHKTGKRVFLVVEMGSTIISSENLNILLSKVNEANGKLLVLQIERNNKNNENESEGEKAFIKIYDVLQESVSRRFFDKFKGMTLDLNRRELLEKITSGVGEWQEQRSPFFYGFYTFQEEYNLKNIERTLEECDDINTELLSDLSLVTIYSQNICIRFSELPRRMHWDDEKISPFLFYEKIQAAVAKLIVVREEGWRICHPLIAKKILCEIYKQENYCESIYLAASGFVERLHKMYGSDDIIADNILKELIIDRSYIDSERTRFSSLIVDIPEFTKRKELFEKLIKLYPQNSHYYNHLARLLAENSSNDYEESIKLLNKAIDIAEKEEPNSIVHYITLGCIYSKSIFAHIKSERALLKQGRLAPSISELIEDISKHYVLADSAFSLARQKNVKTNSYVYYPQIQMECRLIRDLVGYDKDGRTMSQMFRDDNEFRKWYREHFGKAVQLLDEMQQHHEVYDKTYGEYMDHAKGIVKGVDINNDEVERQLLMWKSQEGSEASFYRRTFASSIYVRSGYDWKKVEDSALHVIMDSMYSNVLQSTQLNLQQGDVNYWFETFRRIPEFEAGEAISFIEDYKADGYEKEYLLSWLHFLQLEKKLSSPTEVMKHINRCKDMVPAGVNNISFRDVYVKYSKASPIVSYNDVKHDKNRSIVGLREFAGTIIDIKGSTVGTIQLDDVNLTATFTPSMTDEKGRKREFTSENKTNRVTFNLMFSYSGLKAWNVNTI